MRREPESSTDLHASSRYLLENGADTSLRGCCSLFDDLAISIRKPLSGTPLDYAKQVREDIRLQWKLDTGKNDITSTASKSSHHRNTLGCSGDDALE